jgi:hypothetical protein
MMMTFMGTGLCRGHSIAPAAVEGLGKKEGRDVQIVSLKESE